MQTGNTQISDRAAKKRAVTFHDEIVFDDDGTRVVINRLLDRGDFRRVHLARDVRSTKQLYALKEVQCRNEKDAEECRRESAVHGLVCHENIMPLLGVKFVPTERAPCTCFMLFPYLPRSLEDEISARRLREDRLEKQRRPFSSKQVTQIFAGVVRAVQALHRAGFSHRDIRTENVLLQRGKRRGDVGIPVLTDFGSVGPLSISSNADVAKIREDVLQSTTPAYRAPELWKVIEEECTPGDVNLQYGSADVWSLGCLLFAMLYGFTPFEMEWRLSLVEGAEADGTAHYVGASYERVKESVPFPSDGSAADRRYGDKFTGLISSMLHVVASERPSTDEILETLNNLLERKGKT